MIRVLDKTVADKIAAGEVIDRPVSIVKELVENSLDADASAVTVELKGGGKEYIRVTDDGCGIPAEEAETAFLRHATSKIEEEKDLDAIRTLGFRGEALASICAVARVDMITKTADAHTGKHLIAEGSEIIRSSATGCPDGTTITVRDLFYNVPARKKFLGSDGGESRRITDLLSRIALAYPDVRFRLINGKQEVFRTTGKGNILDCITRVYGRDLAKDLVPVDAARDGLILRGFVSSPGTSASSRNRQFFCVNGRVVASKTMERGLEKAYRERLFPGRFPIAFLFLQMPPDQLDVNVHPTKKEIRFDDEFSVEDFISAAVTEALQQKLAIPQPEGGRPVAKIAEAAETAKTAETAVGSTGAQDSVQEQVPDTKPGTIGTAPAPASSDTSELAAESKAASPFSAPQEEGQQMDLKNVLKDLRQKVGEETVSYDAPPAPDAPFRLEIDQLEVIGSVFSTYIITTDGDSMYLIDQHAAHERVFYEMLLQQYHSQEKLQQTMLLPLQISVSAQTQQSEENWIGYLQEMGYDIENFGPRVYIVRSIPAFMDPAEGERFLRQMLLELDDKPDLHSFASLDRLITRSCKSAIKGGDKLDPAEITALLHRLAECRNPWSCPHGRPTIIRFTRYELERMFKRA